MTANKLVGTQILGKSLRKTGLFDLHSAGLLAKWPMVGFFLFLFGSLVFAGLSYNLVAHGPLLAWDHAIANTLPAIGLKSPAFVKTIMDSGFYLGKEGVMVIGILLGITFILKRWWQELTMLAIGMAGASMLFYSLTALFDRTRPPTQIWIMVNLPGFPSGHAVSAVALFGLLAYFFAPKMRTSFWKTFVVAAALFIIVFIGFTRVFTAGHYLTDVLAGYAVGIAWSGAAYTLIELFFQKRRNQNVKKE